MDNIIYGFAYGLVTIIIALSFVGIFFKMTPYNDIELLKKGNIIASIITSSVFVAFLLPILVILYFGASIIQVIVLSLLVGGIQIVLFKIIDNFLSINPEDNNYATSMVYSVFAIGISLLNVVSLLALTK